MFYYNVVKGSDRMTLLDRVLNSFSHDDALSSEGRLLQAIQLLARREQRPAEQVAAELLGEALARRQRAETNLRRWQMLSPREQEVAALICQNFTNRQIAARLSISPETVKSHIRHLLPKLSAASKAGLRQCLQDWDFSTWLK
jgi:DNA-binding NarL/FixJ family response regulator